VTQVSEKGVFSEPQNLGEIINTPYDEDKPFLHPDGQTLYFSSNGHPGYGGKDLFMSKKVEGVWQKPINLGNAINTLGDEVSIFVNTIGNKAYLARNAESGPGRNNLDLFSFELPKSYRPEKATYMKGLVIHKLTKKPLSAQVKVFDPTASKTIATVQSDSKNGEFLFPISLVSSMYGFNVNKQGFALYSKNIEIQKNNSNAQNLVIEMMPLEKGTKFELRNVFFETAKFDLKSSSKTELDIVVNMLKQHPDLNILISGHTDNVGQESNNKLLSENRAKSVMNFLIEAGVESNRLQYKGFGSLQPLQPNTTPEGRAINRRTEIEIM
jgi:outer membrane protein OmpA-like peptidoglycan-associated protein